MNVVVVVMTAMSMHIAPTSLEAITVYVSMAMMVMVSTVQVHIFLAIGSIRFILGSCVTLSVTQMKMNV